MDVFQEEITFQKMGQASQADIFFDVGGDKSGIFADGVGFPCQGRLVDLEIGRENNSGIG